MSKAITNKTKDWWQIVETIFNAAVELPQAERADYIAKTCKGNDALYADVASLLACDLDEQKIYKAIHGMAVSLAQEDSWVGQRIGSYRLTAELGHGGMGVVYLGERDDQRFEKTVAIKLVTRGMDSPRTRERLIEERKILAQLEHPSIAKLLDGGETDEGIPYFVMEYVDGQPIDQYAAQRQLNAQQCCQLIARVADAVAHAHRNLVVHRDLKPSNILVTADGEPKLLDFGIAGLVADNGATRPVGAFTPKYAAPEVAAGQPVTTSADVFSLGKLLSELQPQSHGDLAAILQRAVATDPAKRYPAAAEFREDLHRLLGGFPVSAQPQNGLYRAAKFVGRNRWIVAASLTAAIGLSATTAFALWQANRANQALGVAETARTTAQQQARAAEAARTDAEQERGIASRERDRAIENSRLAHQRLDQLVALASSTVNGIHDTLEVIPGAIEGRRAMVKQTLAFLNQARESAGGDPKLLQTVANGYLRMGMLLGAPNRPNLGDVEGAIENTRKADAIFTALLKRATEERKNVAEDESLRVDWIQGRRMLSEGLSAAMRWADAAKVLIDTESIAKHWVKESNSIPLTLQLSYIYTELSVNGTLTGDSAKVQRLANQGVAILEPLVARQPDNETLRRALADALSRQLDASMLSGDFAAARRVGLRSAEIREARARKYPDDTMVLRELMLTYSKLSSVAGPSGMSIGQGDTGLAFDYGRKTIALAERIAKIDPANRAARFDWSMALIRTGMIDATSQQQQAECLRYLEQGAAKLEALLQETYVPSYAQNLASAYEFQAELLSGQGKFSEAVALAEKSLKTAKLFVVPGQQQPTRQAYVQLLYSYRMLVRLAAKGGWPRERCIAIANEAYAETQKSLVVYPNLDHFNARILHVQGEMYEQLGDREKSCDAFRKGTEAWKHFLVAANTISPKERAATAEKAAACDSAK